MSKLTNLNSLQMDQFIAFNEKSYPHRKNVKEHFNWWFISNPELKDKNNLNILLCLDENKQIIGQALFNPAKSHFCREIQPFYWGSDYYVSQKHRGVTGILLSMKVLKREIPFIGIGPSDAVGKMFLSSGLTLIGSTRKFVWFRNPLAPFTMIKNVFLAHRQIKYNNFQQDDTSSQFPKALTSHGFTFKLVEHLGSLKECSLEEYHWDDTLEFSRNQDFLKWRFFDEYKKYFFYITKVKNKEGEEKQIYFVVRKGVWKGLTFLFLVDYKILNGDVKEWKAILKLSKELAKLNKCDAVLTICSHNFFEKEIKKSFFIKLGKENLIVTNIKFDVSKEIIQKRNFVYATMADSDQEFSFWW